MDEYNLWSFWVDTEMQVATTFQGCNHRCVAESVEGSASCGSGNYLIGEMMSPGTQPWEGC